MIQVNLNSKLTVVAVVAAALFAGGATAVAATSSHHRQHSQAAKHAPATVEAGASRHSPITVTVSVGALDKQIHVSVGDIGAVARAAIAGEVKSGGINADEADLARLWLNGTIKPDLKLRDSWQSVVKATADYLGLTTTTLQQDLAAGQSLAAIAQAQGRSTDGVSETIVAASKLQLDKAVADGSLPAAGEAEILDLMRENLAAFLQVRL